MRWRSIHLLVRIDAPELFLHDPAVESRARDAAPDACAPFNGSQYAGLQLRGGRKRRVIAVEPAACPSLTKGKYAYDFGDTAHLTPLVKMHTLGSTFIPPGFHAGGLGR